MWLTVQCRSPWSLESRSASTGKHSARWWVVKKSSWREKPCLSVRRSARGLFLLLLPSPCPLAPIVPTSFPPIVLDTLASPGPVHHMYNTPHLLPGHTEREDMSSWSPRLGFDPSHYPGRKVGKQHPRRIRGRANHNHRSDCRFPPLRRHCGLGGGATDAAFAPPATPSNSPPSVLPDGFT